LLDSEDHTCPQCHETDQSPDKLIAIKSLRSAVINYQNESGYTKVTKAMLKAQRERREAEKAVSAAAAARKIEAKQETAKITSSSHVPHVPSAPQAIPTYGMKAGHHYKVGRYQGGQSPGSPVKMPPKPSDSQNNTEQQLTGNKPSLNVSTTVK
jgi:hypothetical protein